MRGTAPPPSRTMLCVPIKPRGMAPDPSTSHSIGTCMGSFQMLRFVALQSVASPGVAMSSSAKAEAALALHRFGMGPRPGSIAAIEADPRGALIAELDRARDRRARAANLPVERQGLPRGDRRVREAAGQGDRRARKNRTRNASRWRKRPPMTEGAAQATGEMAAKMAAEAVPDPGRPIYLEEARIRTRSRARRRDRISSSGWSGSGPIISASRPTRSGACPAPMSARPSAHTCSAGSPTCCWPPRAIRRCCSISTRRVSMGANSIAGINRSRGPQRESRARDSRAAYAGRTQRLYPG